MNRKRTLKVRIYPVVSDAVEAGIAGGLRRADKHANDPLTEEQRERVAHIVHDYVMSQLCEVIDFDV